MLFRTFEHYNSDNDIETKYNKCNNYSNKKLNFECIICYENDNNINRLSQLYYIKNYIKVCECNVCIHEKCFDKWFLTRNNCPICRKIMKTNSKHK
jgi:hypothetical protein